MRLGGGGLLAAALGDSQAGGLAAAAGVDPHMPPSLAVTIHRLMWLKMITVSGHGGNYSGELQTGAPQRWRSWQVVVSALVVGASREPVRMVWAEPTYFSVWGSLCATGATGGPACADSEDVTGSNPVSPTSIIPGQTRFATARQLRSPRRLPQGPAPSIRAAERTFRRKSSGHVNQRAPCGV